MINYKPIYSLFRDNCISSDNQENQRQRELCIKILSLSTFFLQLQISYILIIKIVQFTIKLMNESPIKIYPGLNCPICFQGYNKKGPPLIVCTKGHQACSDCLLILSKHQNCQCGQPLQPTFSSMKPSKSFYQSLQYQMTQIQQKISKRVSNFNSIQNLHLCAQEHYLVALKIQESQVITEKHFCDICKKRLKDTTNIYWHCSICNYDQCAICAQPSSKKCPFGHPIYAQQFRFEDGQKCDVCKGLHIKKCKHCSCGYNICYKCLSNCRQIQKQV